MGEECPQRTYGGSPHLEGTFLRLARVPLGGLLGGREQGPTWTGDRGAVAALGVAPCSVGTEERGKGKGKEVGHWGREHLKGTGIPPPLPCSWEIKRLRFDRSVCQHQFCLISSGATILVEFRVEVLTASSLPSSRSPGSPPPLFLFLLGFILITNNKLRSATMMKSIRMGKSVKATRSFAPRSARRSVAAKAFTVTLETPDGTQTIECPDDVVRSSLFYPLFLF